MENTRELIIETPNGGTVTHIIIDHGNEQFTSMLKSTYEAQQVEHLTEIVTHAPEL